MPHQNLSLDLHDSAIPKRSVLSGLGDSGRGAGDRIRLRPGVDVPLGIAVGLPVQGGELRYGSVYGSAYRSVYGSV